jgi:hypothetical protein
LGQKTGGYGSTILRLATVLEYLANLAIMDKLEILTCKSPK